MPEKRPVDRYLERARWWRSELERAKGDAERIRACYFMLILHCRHALRLARTPGEAKLVQRLAPRCLIESSERRFEELHIRVHGRQAPCPANGSTPVSQFFKR